MTASLEIVPSVQPTVTLSSIYADTAVKTTDDIDGQVIVQASGYMDAVVGIGANVGPEAISIVIKEV